MAADSPYKFLDFYGPEDHRIFFGREREINILVADILVNRLVVLFARTGTGKTSLLNAGARPHLEAQGFQTLYVRVEQDPVEAARDVLREEELLKKEDEPAFLPTQLSLAVRHKQKPLVLFFDQFEEFFIKITDRATRQKFVHDIGEVYRSTQSGVHLVFSMREEYFHEMDEFRSEIPSIFHKNSNLRLLPLDASQAAMAITGPAEARGVEVEPALTEALVMELAQEDGIPPTNLQIVCDTLWRDETRAEHRITLEDYRRAGGWRSILDRRLEEDIEAALGDTNLVALMQKLIPLLRTDQSTKYPRLVSDLESLLGTGEGNLHTLIDRLRQKHIIREITISRARAIEWASDYLAARTDSLQRYVKTIELKRVLRSAMERAKSEKDAGNVSFTVTSSLSGTVVSGTVAFTSYYLSVDEFDQYCEHLPYLTNLNREEAEFLFDAALFYQRRMTSWFQEVARFHKNAVDLLRMKIQDKNQLPELRRGAINLLAELRTSESISLLEEALNEPDLALEVIDVLAGIPGDPSTRILANALEREDLWESVVVTLARTGTERTVSLLRPLLHQEGKFFQSFNALERIAKSSGPVGLSARNALEEGIPVLTELLEREEKFFRALGAAERLSQFGGELGKAAEACLVQTVAKLESLLQDPSHSTSAKNALERLAAYPGRVSEMVAQVLSKPQVKSQIREQVQDTRRASGSLRETIQRFLDKVPQRNTHEDPTREISSDESLLQDLTPFISDGLVIPILGNEFRLEEIFRDQTNTAEDLQADHEELSIGQQLTMLWAENIDYPGPVEYDLAKVAQYRSVETRDPELSKREYLKFLGDTLLSFAEADETLREQVDAMRRRSDRVPFSEIVQWLDYPRYSMADEDPLRQLARLPLPIYVTTSYFNFLERALEAEGKMPRTQLCFLEERKRSIRPEHFPDRDYEPTPAQPAVYHLFGLENYPGTLILSEDEYMRFLTHITEFISSSDLLPAPLRLGLSESRLILLGYQYNQWDFRVLFQLLRYLRSGSYASRGLFVQPKQAGHDQKLDAINYLLYQEQYFDENRFMVYWEDAGVFVQKLWDGWNSYRQG